MASFLPPSWAELSWALEALWHSLLCLAGGALISRFPARRRVADLWWVSLLVTAAVYRQAVVGYLLAQLTAYAVVRGLAWDARRSGDKPRDRWRLACVAMVALGVIFLAGRQYQWESYAISFLGRQVFLFNLGMWSFLRLLTFFWEFGAGRIQRPDWRAYLAWCCLPFTLNGPLLRYSQFEQQLSGLAESPAPGGGWSGRWWREFGAAAGQLVLGLLVSGLQAHLTATGGNRTGWGRFVLWFIFAPWGFYLLWGGYYRLMECLARCWEMRLSPSFNYPFGRRNLSEFWANWNMTVTAVFRDYFFYSRWGLAKINVYLNTLILFLFVGLWHGSNGYWVIWGLLHGGGFCVFLWVKSNRQRFGAWQSERLAAPWRWTAAAITYVFVCSCWVLPPQLLKLLRW